MQNMRTKQRPIVEPASAAKERNVPMRQHRQLTAWIGPTRIDRYGILVVVDVVHPGLLGIYEQEVHRPACIPANLSEALETLVAIRALRHSGRTSKVRL